MTHQVTTSATAKRSKKLVEKRIQFSPSDFDAVVLEKIKAMHPGVAHTSSGALRKALEVFWLIYGDGNGGPSRKEMQEMDLELSKRIADKLEVDYEDIDSD